MTEPKFRPKKLTTEEIKNGCISLYGENTEETRLCIEQEELRQGISMVEHYKHSATFYGSARLKEDNPWYQKARNIAYRIAKETGHAVLSGGGGGIMEAANRGAYEAGGASVGLTIQLPHEQKTNEYVKDVIPFYYFFTRRVAMSYVSEVVLFFPGGFGTYDELFELLTLKQTGRVPDISIVLVGVDFWTPLKNLVDEVMIKKYDTISEKEANIYTITDDEDEILKIVENSKRKID